MKRLFVLGCPRSGTTLIQSMIAADFPLKPVPETHFFSNLSGGLLGRLCPIVAGWRAFRDLPQEVGGQKSYLSIPIRPSYGAYIRQFERRLDELAQEAGAEGWIEKTPAHLHYIDLIEKHIPGSRFVHCIRDGRAVVASLRQVTKNYPNRWGKRMSLSDCINRWNHDIMATESYSEKENHIVVSYESATRNPNQLETCISGLVGIESSSTQETQRSELAKSIVINEPWKDEVFEEVEYKGLEKYHETFTIGQRRRIESQLKLGLYRSLKEQS